MITRKQAEQALACVRQQFKVYIDAGEPEPVLVENWKPFVWQDSRGVETDTYPFAIIWEEGPFEWAYRAEEGGVDEELTLLGREFKEDYVAHTPAAQGWPKGVHGEPYFSYVLTLYAE
ncbi:hypothetical protein ACFW2V_13575 [Streptomyces sp. NPDC058947]|uniref:hypothetical protein n=1 Tax=Streptomyces sp. NPDC058947 TaxID=3346675 RepID=UPI0036C929DD